MPPARIRRRAAPAIFGGGSGQPGGGAAIVAQQNGFPPGPPGHWLLGNLPDFARDIIGFLTRCAREQGDVVGVRLGAHRAVLLSHPEFIERVLVSEQQSFVKHRFFWRHVERLFGNGLLTAHGETWHRQRRLIGPSFQQDRLNAYAGTITELAERRIAAWTDGDERDMRAEMTALTLEVIARIMFDVDIASEIDRIRGAVDSGVEQIARRFRRPIFVPDRMPLPGNRRYLAAVGELNRVVHDLIERRRGDLVGREDLLSAMMRAVDDAGAQMTPAQLRDEVVTILLAGHETTAIALTWALDLLARHAAVQATLSEEIDGVLGGKSAGAGDLKPLRYTEAVINEAMRLYPPIYAFGRQPVADGSIGGYTIPAGTTLFMSQWVMHRDPRFFKEPAQFRPMRWLDGSTADLPRFAYFPFGGGPRICLGQRLAMMEGVLVLAAVARRFRLRATTKTPPPIEPAVTLRPAGPVPVRLHRRQSPLPAIA